VEITFADNRIRKLCSGQNTGIRKLGSQCARKLRARLADLQAAANLEDLRGVPGAGRLHELSGDRRGFLAIDLSHPYRLLLRPTEDPPPFKKDGGLDWSQVTAVTITSIVDYH
jgi:toxin HigB-1